MQGMQLTETQWNILEADGHLLVTGGPGSGKTTVSILKAARIAEQELNAGQKILFLSFARATVSRVVEAIEHEQRIPPAQRRLIDVETYHSFFWRIVKAHGYLIGLPRRLQILTPPGEAIALSVVRSAFPARGLAEDQKAAKKAAEEAERLRLATEEGRICFDLYARYVGDILHGSARIRRLVAAMYPVIILDEFQDTNVAQWRVVEALGQFCRIIALADPEQRIYDWIGADPARLDHFRAAFDPRVFDLSTNNHRSAGTDLALFGNDVLTGQFGQPGYVGIEIVAFAPYEAQALTTLITTTYACRQRLVRQGIERWSLAILVPTKDMTRLVSDALREPPGGMAAVMHTATIEMEAAILGAEVIGLLLQPATGSGHFAAFIDLVCDYFHGKGGDEPTQGALREAAAIRMAHAERLERLVAGRAVRRNSLIVAMSAVYEEVCGMRLTGDPDRDWRALRRVLQDGACARLNEIAEEVRNIRLLERGSQLRQELSQDWRDHGTYRNALAIIRQAFMQEHFATRAKPESGVVVMNMHKAKGKQFDEVIIFEGWPRFHRGQIVANLGRIVRSNERGQINDQARQNLRVSVTRSKRFTTILTPRGNRCVLLPGA
jgi:DNA helicase II / ATP-dependent DNA helicase PcrA